MAALLPIIASLAPVAAQMLLQLMVARQAAGQPMSDDELIANARALRLLSEQANVDADADFDAALAQRNARPAAAS